MLNSFSKKEKLSLLTATFLMPGGIFLSAAYIWRKLKMNKKDNRNLGISAIHVRATEEVKQNPLVRQAYNEMLLERLATLVRRNPSQRFGQLLRNYGYVREERPVSAEKAEQLGVQWRNEFSLESEALLERVERSIKAKIELD